jgi:hypothetical protein
MEVFVIIIVAALFAGIGYAIDKQKGALWGGLLGPLGLIIAAILKAKSN